MPAPGQIWRRPGELPLEVTGFVGRQGELAQLAAQLSRARLVTVTGPGGVGKTRVALRAAAEHAGQFSAGVCLAELAGLRDPELLPNTVATCLGLPEQDARTQLQAVVDYLRDRQLLLILDTCEHLVDGCASLASLLLRETGAVTVLATSRESLDVPGEHTCMIPPLPVPDPDCREAASGDAVELFAQRAAAVVPGFCVTDASREDVIGLCRRLDGIPLAIELAAARLRAMSLDQLAARLEDRFLLLTSGRRTAVPHQQTLRAATGWSYDLCSPAEQLLWARLSVFAESFDVRAAEEVCADEALPKEDVPRTLIGLVDKSVVLRTADDGARYRLLDTVRQFGAEQLAAVGEETALQDRHIACYVAMAMYFEVHPDDNQLGRFTELRREHANLRAALDYALALPGRERQAACLAASLSGYWQISGRLREGRHWLTRVIERFPGPSSERAWVLAIRGIVTTLQGDVAAAVTDLEECIAVAEGLGDRLAGARGYLFLCLALTFTGRYEEAAQAGAIAEVRLSEFGRPLGLAALDAEMGYLHMLAGDLDLAIDRCTLGLSRCREESGERHISGWLYTITGLTQFRLDKHEASAEAARKAIVMKYELGDSGGVAYCLDLLAWLAAGQQRYACTAWLLGAADRLWQLVGRRFSGVATLEAFRRQAEQAAGDALGADGYAALHHSGAACPLDQMITLATGDIDELPPAVPAQAGAPSRSSGLLTSRELEIAELVADGLSNRAIAERLFISKRTVDGHVEHILAKLGASSRVQIANWLRSLSEC